MHTYSKQSLIDWQVLYNGQSFAWITKVKAKSFSVRFRGYETVEGFQTLKYAKMYTEQFQPKG